MIKHKKQLLDQITPIEIYDRVKSYYNNEISYLFESAISSESGSYSFIIIGARQRLQHINGISYYTNEDGYQKEVDSNPLNFLKEYYKKVNTNYYKEKADELNLGYVDGFIGYIGYDMVKEFEPKLKKGMDFLEDKLNIPDFDMIRPKLVLAYSHKTYNLTLLSSLKEFINNFDNIFVLLNSNREFNKIKKATIHAPATFAHSKDKFFKMIDKSKEMIKSGDVFQILMTNRYTQKVTIDPFSFYRVLKSKNPSPYMFILDYKKFNIVGSSPEVMVALRENEILLRPIAGTRKRGKNTKRDKELETEMLHDEKERAEHLMLVDLGRNDVGRVAKKASVQVPALMRVERYSHVMHMVSDITAQLSDDKDMFDLFMATFTAGTMSGAPKIRAMELIAEFEGLKRGFYSGSIGYFGFDGNMDSAITIRTALIKDNEITLQAGAGVVADSINELEYLEVSNKMRALVSSIEDLSNL